MNQKGFVNIILVIVVVMLAGVVGYFAFIKKSEPTNQEKSSIQIPIPTPIQQPNDNGRQQSSSATNLHRPSTATSAVVITTDKQTYGSSEKIIVTIHNNFGSDITTYNQRYDCGIIIVEKQSGTEWKEVRQCFLGAPSRNVTLEQGSVTTEQLRHNFGKLEAGLYRAFLIFSPGNLFSFGNSFTASSASFVIQ